MTNRKTDPRFSEAFRTLLEFAKKRGIVEEKDGAKKDEQKQ